MKTALWTVAAALLIGATLVAGQAQAKSVKWYCVALNPLNPSSYTCYSSSSRP